MILSVWFLGKDKIHAAANMVTYHLFSSQIMAGE